MTDRIQHLQFGARYAELELIPEHTEGIVAFGQPKQVRRVKARVGSIRRGTPFFVAEDFEDSCDGGSYVTYRQVTDGSADTIVDVVAPVSRRARSPEALDAERA